MIRKTLIVTDTERGLLIRDGRLIDILEPGKHVLWDVFGRLQVERVNILDTQFNSPWAEIMEKCRADLAARTLTVVRVPEGEVAVVSYDGKPSVIVLPGEVRYFWHVLKEISVRRIDVASEMIIARSDLPALEVIPQRVGKNGAAITTVTVESHEAGLAFVDGELVHRLAPGKHGFWQVGRKVDLEVLDTRPLPLEVTAQEILTKDKVSLRVTLTCFTQVTDAENAALSTPDYTSHIYKLVQFAVREAIGGRRLDEVLNERTSVDAQIVAHVREALGNIGVSVAELGIKDVILPGDMRELINRVVEAEKMAEANIIRRKEETAATRSLLNTARLMEGNPTLMRLKELEALEKVTEKIGRIDVHASNGEGLNAVLDRLVSLKG